MSNAKVPMGEGYKTVFIITIILAAIQVFMGSKSAVLWAFYAIMMYKRKDQSLESWFKIISIIGLISTVFAIFVISYDSDTDNIIPSLAIMTFVHFLYYRFFNAVNLSGEYKPSTTKEAPSGAFSSGGIAPATTEPARQMRSATSGQARPILGSDEKLYLEATAEFSLARNPALWAKVLALHDGNEERSKYAYIRERVAQGMQSINDTSVSPNPKASNEFFGKNGESYWSPSKNSAPPPASSYPQSSANKANQHEYMGEKGESYWFPNRDAASTFSNKSGVKLSPSFSHVRERGKKSSTITGEDQSRP